MPVPAKTPLMENSFRRVGSPSSTVSGVVVAVVLQEAGPAVARLAATRRLTARIILPGITTTTIIIIIISMTAIR